MRQRKLTALLLVSVLMIAGCTKLVHPKHPNQINDLDGYAYDSLTVAQAALDEAKVQFANGKFDDRKDAAKQIINTGGGSYDVARVSWNTWRDVANGLQAGDVAALETKLRADLSDLGSKIAAVKSLTGGSK